MSETQIEAPSNEHDVAIAEAHAEAAQAVAEADAEGDEWRAELSATVTRLQDGLSAELAAIRAEQAMLADRLDQLTPPQPEPTPEPNPPNPPEEPAAVPDEAPEEPKPPERKRAHRWI